MNTDTVIARLSFSDDELHWLHMALVFAKREIKNQLDALPDGATGVSINIFNNLQKELPAMIKYVELNIDANNND